MPGPVHVPLVVSTESKEAPKSPENVDTRGGACKGAGPFVADGDDNRAGPLANEEVSQTTARRGRRRCGRRRRWRTHAKRDATVAAHGLARRAGIPSDSTGTA